MAPVRHSSWWWSKGRLQKRREQIHHRHGGPLRETLLHRPYRGDGSYWLRRHRQARDECYVGSASVPSTFQEMKAAPIEPRENFPDA